MHVVYSSENLPTKFTFRNCKATLAARRPQRGVAAFERLVLSPAEAAALGVALGGGGEGLLPPVLQTWHHLPSKVHISVRYLSKRFHLVLIPSVSSTWTIRFLNIWVYEKSATSIVFYNTPFLCFTHKSKYSQLKVFLDVWYSACFYVHVWCTTILRWRHCLQTLSQNISCSM